MPDKPLTILAVIGSLHKDSATRTVVHYAAGQFKSQGCHVDILDFEHEPLALFNPDTSHASANFSKLKTRVEHADVILLATPDYHGSMSSALKNFLDHFWREFAGKLFVSIVASHEKGLTVTDQLRTVARQCYAWSLPYGVSFTEGQDVKGGEIISDSFKTRLEMMVRDARVYGQLIARQRQADLADTDHSFLARHRK